METDLQTPERQQTSAEQASCGLSVTDIMVMILYGDLVKLQVICIASLGIKKAWEVRENKRNLPDSQLLSYSLQLFGLCMQFTDWGFHHWSRSPCFSRRCSEKEKKWAERDRERKYDTITRLCKLNYLLISLHKVHQLSSCLPLYTFM